MVNALDRNTSDIDQELSWLVRVIDARFKLYFGLEGSAPESPAPPDLTASKSSYAAFVRRYKLDYAERVGLALGLAPHLRPQLLDVFFTRNQTFDRRFTEFGGQRREPDGDFWPTGETLAFVVAGTDLPGRLRIQALFEPDHVFAKRNILRAVQASTDEPIMKARLRLSDDALALFTTDKARSPVYSTQFPAQKVETRMTWDDLVLHPATRMGLAEIQSWIEHGPTLMQDWGMADRLRPGYRALFHGPSGTGKTLTACLLGKSTRRDVYRVDLSMVVSKYIGETEKNLAMVFDQAEGRKWILFFDEADALFGKRSETRDSHDRYANQEVAYLLQRIETFNGVAFLASNLRDNMDDAFLRRFESVVYFPMPRTEERLRLWQQGFPAKARLAADLDLEAIARDYVLSGGGIMNVVRAAAPSALSNQGRPIGRDDVIAAIRREMAKEGRA